jgi:hypothetical protein
MDDAAIKEARKRLRQVQAHMSQAHRNLGAEVDVMGLVDVFHHPESTLPHLNYVALRKNTAWVPGPEIEKGLGRLRDLERVPRVYYVEGLYPPIFAKSLRELGLTVEREIAIMTYQADPGRVQVGVTAPNGMHAQIVSDQDGIALWWYVWRNARYDVVSNGVEPVYVGKDMRELVLGNQVDIILYHHRFPVGVARMTINNETANITALAVMKEARTPENLWLLYHKALRTAIDRGCKLIFTAGETEADRRLCRKIGFVDAGSVVCYADLSDSWHEAKDDDHLEQPAFIL